MATVETMVTEFGCCASDVVVAVGPSVGPCCFALKPQEAQEFRQIHPDCVPDPESPSPHVNIRLANRYRATRKTWSNTWQHKTMTQQTTVT